MPKPRTEVPSGAIDGVNTSFTAPTAYTSGTLVHYLNGQLKLPANDDGLIESSPSTGDFTLKEAPETDDVLQVRYLDTSPDEELTGLMGLVADLDVFTVHLIDAEPLLAQASDLDTLPATIDDPDTLLGTLIDIDTLTGTVIDVEAVICD